MNVKIYPSDAKGNVLPPPSKSLAHRGLICGALSGGSVVENLDFSKDISATVDCLKALGAKVDVNGKQVKIGGLNPFDIPDNLSLFCNESGSTLRFLIPICLLSGKNIKLSGAKRLFERPLDIYEKICKEQGILFEKGEDYLNICGRLKSGNYRVAGDVSSQFISGLLFALPLLDGVSIIEIDGDFESKSYVDLTLDVLNKFGVRINYLNNRFIIMGNQKYKSFDYSVEGDMSNIAFLEAFNYVGGKVQINGIPSNSLQGDRVYKDIFHGLENGVKRFDLTDCPDLGPIAFTMAAIKGGALFNGTKRLKLKESDRCTAMAEELKKFGIQSQVGADYMLIEKSVITAPKEVLNSHNDHRIAMALSVLCAKYGGEISGAEAVAKSYPDFFNVLKSLDVEVDFFEA